MSDYIDHTKRVQYNYTMKQQNRMKRDKQIILLQLTNLDEDGTSVIYENQIQTAAKIVDSFKNREVINVMVIAKTQSGKTGSMCATIKQYLEETNNLIPIENIYIITGLSSCEWKEQTKQRMPESIQSRVFHRCELPITFVEEIKMKNNILIIMDEIQVAAKKGQTIYNAFKAANLLDKNKLYENDIKILEYTATPDGTIYDLMKWGEASVKILATAGRGYVSAFNLFEMGRVKQCKDLCGDNAKNGEIDEKIFDNIREIKDDIDKYERNLYNIIRSRNGSDQDITINNFKEIFNPENYEFIKYDKESEIEDINKTLVIPPKKHTFIFLKEMCRCAKTLIKTNLGILYERYCRNPDDSTIIQGLIGRDTGYDNNGISICYTYIDSIIRYEQLWNSNFEDTTIKWNSKTTKYKNGILFGINTFNDPKNYDGFSTTSEDSIDEVDEPKPIIKTKSFDEIKKWFKENKKDYGNGPKKRKPDENGFYKCITQFSKEEKIRTIEEFETYETTKKWGFRGNTQKSKDKNKYRVYPVYSNSENKDTLEWWLVYY